MDKSQALQILKSRKLIAVAGKYQLRAVSVVLHTREDGTVVNIINLNAMSPYHVEQAKAQLMEGNYQEATNFAFSTNARLGRDFTPAKGEIINVIVDNITNKDGIDALMVVGISPVAVSKAASVDFSSFDDESAEEEVDIDSMGLTALKAFIADNELDVKYTATTTLPTLRTKVKAALEAANSLV